LPTSHTDKFAAGDDRNFLRTMNHKVERMPLGSAAAAAAKTGGA
jgi:hypothetical protein